MPVDDTRNKAKKWCEINLPKFSVDPTIDDEAKMQRKACDPLSFTAFHKAAKRGKYYSEEAKRALSLHATAQRKLRALPKGYASAKERADHTFWDVVAKCATAAFDHAINRDMQEAEKTGSSHYERTIVKLLEKWEECHD
jgi:hypothetical protein